MQFQYPKLQINKIIRPSFSSQLIRYDNICIPPPLFKAKMLWILHVCVGHVCIECAIRNHWSMVYKPTANAWNLITVEHCCQQNVPWAMIQWNARNWWCVYVVNRRMDNIEPFVDLKLFMSLSLSLPLSLPSLFSFLILYSFPEQTNFKNCFNLTQCNIISFNITQLLLSRCHVKSWLKYYHRKCFSMTIITLPPTITVWSMFSNKSACTIPHISKTSRLSVYFSFHEPVNKLKEKESSHRLKWPESKNCSTFCVCIQNMSYSIIPVLYNTVVVEVITSALIKEISSF